MLWSPEPPVSALPVQHVAHFPISPVNENRFKFGQSSINFIAELPVSGVSAVGAKFPVKIKYFIIKVLE